MTLDLLYAAISLPLLSLALRCWARWARREGGLAFVLLGVVLAALGIDGLRQLLRRAEEVPSAPGFVMALIVGLAAYLGWRNWTDLNRPRRPRKSLEELVQEARERAEARAVEPSPEGTSVEPGS